MTDLAQNLRAVRARIDWKYALGLELTDPGFHFSVLGEFRARLIAGDATHLLLDAMLERFKARGLVKARGRQRTDSTHVLAAIRTLNRVELVAETLRAALNDIAVVAPDWLRALAPADWHERYDMRVEERRIPEVGPKRDAYAGQQQHGHEIAAIAGMQAAGAEEKTEPEGDRKDRAPVQHAVEPPEALVKIQGVTGQVGDKHHGRQRPGQGTAPGSRLQHGICGGKAGHG